MTVDGQGGIGWRVRAPALLLLAALLALRILDPAPLEALRLRQFDLFQAWQPRVPASDAVVIVDIDDGSLARIGQWPWPRDQLAELVEAVAAARPAVLGLDVLFPDADRTSPGRLAERLPGLDQGLRERLQALPSNDRRLAMALRTVPTVLGAAVGGGLPSIAGGSIGTGAALLQRGGDPRPFLTARGGLLGNLPELEAVSAGRGIVSLDLEPDGVLRRLPLLAQVGEHLVPALAVEMLRVVQGSGPLEVVTGEAGIERLRIGGMAVDTDPAGRLWIHYAPVRAARYVAAADLLEAPGRIVLLGSTATGLLDVSATPIGQRMAGVEVHAQALENILEASFLTRPAWGTGLEFVLALALGLVLVAGQPALRAPAAIGLFLALLVALAAGAWWCFAAGGLLLDAGFPMVVVLLLFLSLISAGLLREERLRREQALAAALRERERETRLRGLQAELTQAMHLSAVAQVSSSIAHELNQPLTAIGLYARAASTALERQPEGATPKVRETLARIADGASRAQSIIGELRALIRGGGAERTAGDLNAAVDEACDLAMVGPLAERARLTRRYAEGLPELPFNRVQLQQLVVNLVRNALDAQAESARAEVEVATVPADGGGAVLTVRDRGPGIAPEVLQTLFDPFVSTKNGGMGLGLAICRAIAEAHGGRLEADNAPDGGACFRLTLPGRDDAI